MPNKDTFTLTSKVDTVVTQAPATLFSTQNSADIYNYTSTKINKMLESQIPNDINILKLVNLAVGFKTLELKSLRLLN